MPIVGSLEHDLTDQLFPFTYLGGCVSSHQGSAVLVGFGAIVRTCLNLRLRPMKSGGSTPHGTTVSGRTSQAMFPISAHFPADFDTTLTLRPALLGVRDDELSSLDYSVTER